MNTIPTTNQLYNTILGDLQTQYGSTIPLFTKVWLRALAAVQAAKLRLFYLQLSDLQKNIFVDTADPAAYGGTLERFGFVKLGRYPFAAVAGQYQVTVTGLTGSQIAINTTFKSNDDSINPGQLFILDVAYTMPSTTGTITLRALTPGEVSKLSVGDKLTATAPIAGVDSLVTVTVESVEPLNSESIEDYRSKAIDAYRLETQGGAGTDYRVWAADAQGVQKVYPYAKSGAVGQIDLYVEATLVDSTDGKGTPSASILSDVEDVVNFDPDTTLALNERGRRPLNVIVNYLPVTIRNVDIVITGFVGLTPAIQTAINNALKEQVDSIRPFVASSDILADKNSILDVNRIISTILLARPGSSFTSVSLSVQGAPYSSYEFVFGFIPYFNSVTYN